jgi:hypothetical protein
LGKRLKKIGLAVLVNRGIDKGCFEPCSLRSLYTGGEITSSEVSVKFPQGVTKVMEDRKGSVRERNEEE